MLLRKGIIDVCLRLATRLYRALPIPAHSRQRLNVVLLGRFYFLTRHALRAMDPLAETALALARSLARLAEAQADGPQWPLVLDTAPLPDVSIVIPVFNNADYTALCLRSIAESGTRRRFEVIVVDDASTDNTASMLGETNGLRVLRNERNLGFIRSCNLGAAAARGRLLLFLNNDTWVVPGWLDALADTIDRIDSAGLVGSKLVYPDGRLQEAGGILWNDASGWNYGRMQDPNKPEFGYLRDVDYCSGASIMLEKSLFDSIGGFDERYCPAYFEDADLAFAVRAASLRVLYQPTSEVIHFEGISSGRDLTRGIKAYQVTNRLKFREKWANVLAGHRPPNESPEFEKERTIQRRALVIDVRTPMPDRDAGSIEAFNYLRLLLDLGFKVAHIPSEAMFNAGSYTRALQFIGVECLYHPYVTDVVSHLRERGTTYDLVMLNRVHNAARHIDDVRRYCPNARIVFNTVDLHFLREQRQAELAASPAMVRAAGRTREIELQTMRKADATIVLSLAERELLEREVPEVALFTIPLVREVPGRSTGFATRRDFLFIGGYEHPPNADAVLYFANEIWPLIHRRLPDTRFFIIGSNAPDEIRSLQGDGIVFVGYVEDIAPYFGNCRLSVVPLRYGAGIKGKIATALGFGMPCIATPIAVEGMGLTDGCDIVVADQPAEFADAAVRLYYDEATWQMLSDNGLAFVEKNYSLANSRTLIAEMLDHLLALPAGHRNALIARRKHPAYAKAHLQVSLVDDFAEYSRRATRMGAENARRAQLETRLIPGWRPFILRGYCYCCGSQRRFLVEFKYAVPDATMPNWRQRLICWRCRLNNRVRASLQIFEEVLRPGHNDAIFVTEQGTPLFRWLSKNYPDVTGSEHLGNQIPVGTLNTAGVRNESLYKLSFPDASFDYILSFDVLEHIPDYRAALAECLRCLKPGGGFLFSVPFRSDRTEHLERARLRDDGSVEHFLPAEYYGDPINSDGCLCFHHFGWNLLDEMRDMGFSRASACLYWSKEYAYLGGENILFLGIKSASVIDSRLD